MKRAEVLDEAKKCVCGQRPLDYGTPEDNFTTIGYLWATYLRAAHPDLPFKLPLNGISAKDVAVMMSLLKVARIATGTSPDSFIDLAGYAACAGEIATQQRGECKTEEQPCTDNGLKLGVRFEYKGIKWVCLDRIDGKYLCVAADVICKKAFDKEDHNNFAESSLCKWLHNEWLKKTFTQDEINTVLSMRTVDLTADDGGTEYGSCEVYAAPLTCDQYRKYRAFMPEYDDWVWTCTPWTTYPSYASIVRFICTAGQLSDGPANSSLGVAPACLFNPCIVNLTPIGVTNADTQ